MLVLVELPWGVLVGWCGGLGGSFLLIVSPTAENAVDSRAYSSAGVRSV